MSLEKLMTIGSRANKEAYPDECGLFSGALWCDGVEGETPWGMQETVNYWNTFKGRRGLRRLAHIVQKVVIYLY